MLDTNVVLGWLLFEDPSGVAIGEAIATGHVTWLASAPLRAELAYVLVRGISRWPCDVGAVLARFDRHATIATPHRSVVHRLKCTDGDDQKFIDLALDHGAFALLSRDRAVLRLARRAQCHGVTISTPDAWLAHQTKRAAEAAL